MRDKQEVFQLRLDEAPIKELRGERGISSSLIGPYVSGTTSIDLHRNILRPHSGPGPRHFHRQAENIYWVQEGSIEVRLDNRTVTLGPDEIILIPPGVVHGTSNPGESDAKFIEIYIPAGDDFHIVEDDTVS